MNCLPAPDKCSPPAMKNGLQCQSYGLMAYCCTGSCTENVTPLRTDALVNPYLRSNWDEGVIVGRSFEQYQRMQ